MKSWDKTSAWAALSAVVALACVAHPAAAQNVAVPIRNLRMPLEHYPDGTVKMQLRAEHALVPETGVIVASNVVFELFREDASPDAMIVADDCRYDRENNDAASESNLRIERGRTVISGKGFEWNGQKERVKILSNVRVLLERDLSKTGGYPGREGKDRGRE